MSDNLSLQKETTVQTIDRINKTFWKDTRVLITGITGFVGSWLTELLSSNEVGANVYGLLRRQSNPNLRNIQHLLCISHTLNQLSFCHNTAGTELCQYYRAS